MKEFSRFFQIGIPSNVILITLSVSLLAVLIVSIMPASINKKRWMLLCILVDYMTIVVLSTTVCRFTMPYHKAELIPLWSVYAITHNIQGAHMWEIVLNMLLFTPIGFLLSFCGNTRWWVIVLIGMIFSISIEFSQFFFYKGIAQTDDVINNTLGTIIGVGIGQFQRSVRKK